MKKQNEDAVSPVIGVMLMLVVTIVIAAVVAAFAGGLATETESAPVAVLDADVYAGDKKIVLRSLSGDSLKLEETAVSIQSVKGDPIADLVEDLAAEQKARATYDNILRFCDDPDVSNVIRYLREREVVHFQRFGEPIHTNLRRFFPYEKAPQPRDCSALFNFLQYIILPLKKQYFFTNYDFINV